MPHGVVLSTSMDDHIPGRQPDPTPARRPASGRRSRRERSRPPGDGAADGTTRRSDHRAPTRRQVVAIGASSLAVLAVAGGIGGFSLYHRLESNLTTVDIGHSPGEGGA